MCVCVFYIFLHTCSRPRWEGVDNLYKEWFSDKGFGPRFEEIIVSRFKVKAQFQEIASFHVREMAHVYMSHEIYVYMSHGTHNES